MDLSQVLWRKSSRSLGGGNECVEVASASQTVLIRDSTDPAGPIHIMRIRAFRALIDRIKVGELDL